MPPHRLIAIDPSLTCSGWALFEVKDGVLLGVGKIRSKPPALPLPLRLVDLQTKVNQLLDGLGLGKNDFLICEAPTTMRDPRAALRVEQVRTIFESLARDRSVQVPGRLNPRTVQYEVMGLRGKQLTRAIVKDTAVQIVQTTFATSLHHLGFDPSVGNLKRNQDIVDALLVGALGLTRVQGARAGGAPAESFFLERTVRGTRRLSR